jgi:hypothetical protein
MFKNLFFDISSWALSFIFNYAMIYWLGTKDQGFCFVLAFLLANLTTGALNNRKKDLKSFVPIFQQVDDNINRLFDITSTTNNDLIEKVEYLEEKIRLLEDEIENLKS